MLRWAQGFYNGEKWWKEKIDQSSLNYKPEHYVPNKKENSPNQP